jgi:hypothetical protein
MPATLEVHRHSYISGPLSRRSGTDIVHSHEGGNGQHYHPATGPATYTIDKDEWWLQTGGLRGGGRKRFTTRPVGPQLDTTITVRG